MSNVISIQSIRDNNTNQNIQNASTVRLRAGLISASAEPVESNIVAEHAAEPIKSTEDIKCISQYLIDQGRYRDNMLFVLGINLGLRVSDLVTLRFTDLIDDEFCFRDSIAVLEKKTSNTRKRKANRRMALNDAVVSAVTLYLEHEADVRTVTLSDYLFRSESNNGSNENRPMHRNSVDRILKGIASDLNLGIKMSTHTLRKTFGYHQMMNGGNDPRRLILLQKIFGHSSSTKTLCYIGITAEEIEESYRSLNLGLAEKKPENVVTA